MKEKLVAGIMDKLSKNNRKNKKEALKEKF
jgi:hypothetical protein